jgi:ABC-type multidrug transport system ATPase subunit
VVDRLILLDQGHVLADGPRDAILQAVQEGRVLRNKTPSAPAPSLQRGAA